MGRCGKQEEVDEKMDDSGKKVFQKVGVLGQGNVHDEPVPTKSNSRFNLALVSVISDTFCVSRSYLVLAEIHLADPLVDIVLGSLLNIMSIVPVSLSHQGIFAEFLNSFGGIFAAGFVALVVDSR